MGFMDRAREAAEKAAAVAQQGIDQGQQKFDDFQQQRSASDLYRKLGEAFYAEQRSGGPRAAVNDALTALDQWHIQQEQRVRAEQAQPPRTDPAENPAPGGPPPRASSGRPPQPGLPAPQSGSDRAGSEQWGTPGSAPSPHDDPAGRNKRDDPGSHGGFTLDDL